VILFLAASNCRSRAQEIERLQQELLRAQQQRGELDATISRLLQQAEEVQATHAQELAALRRQMDEQTRELDAAAQKLLDARYGLPSSMPFLCLGTDFRSLLLFCGLLVRRPRRRRRGCRRSGASGRSHGTASASRSWCAFLF
jgi:hypothetical protein